MSNTDGLFNQSLLNAGKSAISVMGDDKDKNNTAKINLFIQLLLVLLITGADGMKVIFRSNFGKKGISLTKLMLCAGCFAWLSYLSFNQTHFWFDIEESGGTAMSFYIGGTVFALMAVCILVRGIVSYIKAAKEYPYSDYQGDSSLLGFLKGYGYTQQQIQDWIEPLYTVTIGVLLYLYNPIAGLPIVFCGISLWFSVLWDYANGKASATSMKNALQHSRKESVVTNQVSID